MRKSKGLLKKQGDKLNLMRGDLSRSRKRQKLLWKRLGKSKRKRMSKKGEGLKERSMKHSRPKSELLMN